jgi:anti-sigma B factor antagonist
MEIATEKKDGFVYLRFGKEFSIRNIMDVESRWEAAKLDGTPVIVFDCRRLEFIDSSAIGTLVKYRNEAGNHSITLIILNASESIRKIFHTARLSLLFTMLDQRQFDKEFIHGRSDDERFR